jgi:integrase
LLGMDDVKGFLSHLAINKQVAASSQNQAFNALLFLFKNVLQKEFGKIEGVVWAKRRPYILVLSQPEADRIIGLLEPPYDLIAKLLYGCGLRLFECLKLQVQDLNFDMKKVLTVHDGKGQKARTMPMPATLTAELTAQIEQVTALHERNLAANYAGVFLPSMLDIKYKNAAKELAWQWLFPAKTLTLIPDTDYYLLALLLA